MSWRVVVIGSQQTGLTAAAGPALELIKRSQASTALLCCWSTVDFPAHSRFLFRSPAAERLAEQLRLREVQSQAVGKLVLVDITAGYQQLLPIVSDVASSVPLISLFAGARNNEVDCLLNKQDAVLTALDYDVESSIIELATTNLSSFRIPAVICKIHNTLPARFFATAGICSVSSLSSDLAPFFQEYVCQ